MGSNGAKSGDFYQVLGLNKECTDAQLRKAYKKLALKWHPDRCSAEEAKNKFQAIQQAYSVLSDENKRFLYDVGVYDSDDDQDGMADFMTEMAMLMTQNKPNGNGESFEELQDMFEEMFGRDIESAGSSTSYSSSNFFSNFGESSSSTSSRSNTKTEDPSCFDACFQGNSTGMEDTRGRGGVPNRISLFMDTSNLGFR